MHSSLYTWNPGVLKAGPITIELASIVAMIPSNNEILIELRNNTGRIKIKLKERGDEVLRYIRESIDNHGSVDITSKIVSIL